MDGEEVAVRGVLKPRALGRLDPPSAFRIVVRVEAGEDLEEMRRVIVAICGEAAIARRDILNLAGRVYFDVGRYTREVAEARAEMIRRKAALENIHVHLQIKRS